MLSIHRRENDFDSALAPKHQRTSAKNSYDLGDDPYISYEAVGQLESLCADGSAMAVGSWNGVLVIECPQALRQGGMTKSNDHMCGGRLYPRNSVHICPT